MPRQTNARAHVRVDAWAYLRFPRLRAELERGTQQFPLEVHQHGLERARSPREVEMKLPRLVRPLRQERGAVQRRCEHRQDLDLRREEHLARHLAR